jgi:ketosteroid isomerase-like protein
MKIGPSMRPVPILLIFFLMVSSCKPSVDKEDIKKEIFRTEKAFEKMTRDQSVAAAFYFYADSNAVINRGNDSLIIGKENIRNYYDSRKAVKAIVQWTPDFIDVSDCGTLGYSYGKYEWKIVKDTGDTLVSRGVFHTVWKKQKDGNWKYVWD